MPSIPKVQTLGSDPSRGSPLTHAQAGVLVRAEETSELEIIVARHALKPAPEVAPEQRDTAYYCWVRRQLIDNHRQMVKGRRAHEIIAKPCPEPAGPDALVTGSLRTQVKEADFFEVAALGNPAEHASPMAINAVPHDLPYESANFDETGDSVELSHAH